MKCVEMRRTFKILLNLMFYDICMTVFFDLPVAFYTKKAKIIILS